MASELHPRVNILGVNVSAVTMEEVLEAMAGWIARGERRYVCVTPSHTVMDCRTDPELRRIVNAAGLVTPDGMAIVWLLRWRGHRRVERVYGPDLVVSACARSLREGWRHFFCGGAPGVAERLTNRLLERFPNLAVAGTAAPPFRPLSADEDRHLVEAINATCPDILWVGLGSPKQERWMAEHAERIQVPVMVGVGAAFDPATCCR